MTRFIVIGVLSMGAGCAFQKDQIRRGNVEVEAVSLPGFEFYDVAVTQQGADFTINGLLRHDHRNVQASQHPGHVHITVVGVDGNTVAWAGVPYRPSHPHSAYLRFSASVSAMKGATVRLEQHANEFHNPDCE